MLITTVSTLVGGTVGAAAAAPGGQVSRPARSSRFAGYRELGVAVAPAAGTAKRARENMKETDMLDDGDIAAAERVQAGDWWQVHFGEDAWP